MCGELGKADVYDMQAGVSLPLTWAANAGHAYSCAAFAIGGRDAPDAAQLRVITDTFNDDANRPALNVRNTWRGFEYTISSGDDAVWTNCGYDPQLYVVYYKQTPTVIMFREQTVGSFLDGSDLAQVHVVGAMAADYVV